MKNQIYEYEPALFDPYFFVLTQKSAKKVKPKKILPAALGRRFPAFWRARERIEHSHRFHLYRFSKRPLNMLQKKFQNLIVESIQLNNYKFHFLSTWYLFRSGAFLEIISPKKPARNICVPIIMEASAM